MHDGNRGGCHLPAGERERGVMMCTPHYNLMGTRNEASRAEREALGGAAQFLRISAHGSWVQIPRILNPEIIFFKLSGLF